jgi:hypothetical protein
VLVVCDARLEVKQSAQGNYVPGLTQVAVTSNEEVAELMARCDRNRREILHYVIRFVCYIAIPLADMLFAICYLACDNMLYMFQCGVFRSQTATDMNEHSSRSHMMLTVTVESTHRHSNVTSRGKMNLVCARSLRNTQC